MIVEIGNNWLKIARAAGGLGPRKIDALQCAKLPESKEAYPETLSNTLQKMHVKAREAILLLPRHLVTARMLRIPATDPDEVSRMVRLQAGRQTPYSKEEVVSGYRVIDTDPQGYSRVLLVIARRVLITDRIQALADAGITAVGVGISTEGLITWLERSRDTSAEVLAVLNVDAGYAELAVFEYGSLVYTKAILIGAAHIGDDRAKWIPEIAREVQGALTRYKTDTNSTGATRLAVCGALHDDEDLVRLLGEHTRMNVDSLGALDKQPVSHPGKSKKGFDERLVSPVAVLGTAVAGEAPEADLMLPDLRISHVMDQRRGQLTAMGGLTIILVTLLSGLMLLGLYKRDMVLKRLDEQLGELAPRAERVRSMRSQMLLMQRRLDARRRPVTLFAELHRVTPETIRVSWLTIDDNQGVSIRGNARSMNQVVAYVSTLESSDYFANVKTTYTSQKETQRGNVAEFQINCRYEEDRPVPDA